MNVILLKDYSSDYEQALQSRGYTVEFLPVLSARSVNQSRVKQLFTKSPHMQNYSGLIVTSQKAFESIKDISDQVHSDWLALKTWVVGPKTYEVASTFGFTDILGKESGNAKALAQSIISNDTGSIATSSYGVYLFLVGDKTRSTLVDSLEEARLKVETVQVYETENIMIDTRLLGGSIVVVFSPSGLASLDPSFLESISTSEQSKNIQWVSIGPATSQALSAFGISSVQAEKPSADGVLRAITLDSSL